MPDKEGYLTAEEYDALEWEKTCALTHEDIMRICSLSGNQTVRDCCSPRVNLVTNGILDAPEALQES